MSGRYRGITVNMTGTSVQKGFVLLMIGTALLFIVTGIISSSRAPVSFSSPALQKLVSGISKETLVYMISNEIPLFQSGENEAGRLQVKKLSSFFFELATSINPDDPRTFLGRELPGFESFDFDILVSAEGVNYTHFPMESPPATDTYFASGTVGENGGSGTSENTGNVAGNNPATTPGNGPNNSGNNPGNTSNGGVTTNSNNQSASASANSGKKMVFIYHTHNRESWLTIPELKGEEDSSRAYHAKKNITLVGKRLAEQLQLKGVDTKVNTDDHMGKVKYSHSYASSMQSVKQAMAANKNIAYFFDIHRNSSLRKDSTVTVQGKTYARIYFVIGKSNPHWEKNLDFAKKIHEKLNERYPGLSKGIIGKSESQGHGEYNQSISEQSLIIEVGGYENTMEESYRTADALAEIIASLYWENAGPV